MAGSGQDSPLGFVHKREDFNVTAIADLPEIDTQAVTGDTIAVVTPATNYYGGWLRMTPSTSNDDDVSAVTFGALNFNCKSASGGGDLLMEARLKIGTAITDYKFFVGFGDSIATADETTFSVTTATTTIDTQTDAIGFVYDNDETTPVIHCVSGTGDVVTVDYKLDASLNLVLNTIYTFRVHILDGGQAAVWSINGREVYRYRPAAGSSAVIIGDVPLVPGVWAYEQGTAFTVNIDYIEAQQARN